MLEWIKCIELYNCLGSTVFGLSSLGNYNDVRGRLYLYLIFYKIWGNGVN